MRNHFFKDSHKNICIDASFVSLVNNKNVIFPANHQLSNGHTVSDEWNFRILWTLLLEPHIITNFLAKIHIHLVSHTLCKRNSADSSGLGYQDSIEKWVYVLWNLRRFSRTGLPTNNGNLVIFDRLYNLVMILQNR